MSKQGILSTLTVAVVTLASCLGVAHAADPIRGAVRVADETQGTVPPGSRSPTGPGMMGGDNGMGPGMMGPQPGGPPPSSAGLGGRAFVQVCQQCHALPDPHQHTASEWPAVVARMKRYMAQGGRVPSPARMRAIVKFLQAQAETR